MSRSQIFEEFVKIAQERGVIDTRPSDASFKKLESNPRADSLDISAISALYGVKPDLSDDMSYKNNIMEMAHKDSVVVSPAYDALNGLVENNIERQNIMLRLVNRNPDGLLTQRKYAEAELTMTLVRIAEEMDDLNRENLRILADNCLINANNNFKKKGFKKIAFLDPVTIGIIAASLGALWYQQHSSFKQESVDKNYKKLKAELLDLQKSSKGWGFGYDLSPKFRTDILAPLIKTVDDFNSLYNEHKSIIDSMQQPRTAEELKQMAASPINEKNIESFKVLNNAASNMYPYLEQIKALFSNESKKSEYIVDTGLIQSGVDKLEIFHGGKGLIADNFDDVVRALDPYVASIKQELEILNSAKSFQEDAKNKLQQAQSSSPFDGSTAASSSSTSAGPSAPTPPVFK